jgi:hypothetical protein
MASLPSVGRTAFDSEKSERFCAMIQAFTVNANFQRFQFGEKMEALLSPQIVALMPPMTVPNASKGRR